MLLWLVMSVLGFVALTGVIIALGVASTARYEEERRTSSESTPTSPDGDRVAALA